MDFGTGLAALGAGYGGKDIVLKLLGPTAEYFGNGLKGFTEKRARNVQNIFKNAKAKLGTKIEEEGSIPPKVLAGTINNGSYADSDLEIEYFGGVLASSRTSNLRDDRGANFNALISRISSYQLRMHYLIYHALKREYSGEDINIGINIERDRMKLFIPMTVFIESMDFNDDEKNNYITFLDHIINGLIKDNLIGDTYRYGSGEFLKMHNYDVNCSGVVLQPSLFGIELFYWAYGQGKESIKTFLDLDRVFKLDVKIPVDNRIVKISND